MRQHDLLLCSPEPDDAYSYEVMISSKRADGIIFLGQGPGDGWLKDLARTPVPFVVWGAVGEDSSYCTVGSDNRKGGMLAGQRFVELGRNRIAFVGNRSHPEMEQNARGLKTALTLAGRQAEIVDLEIPDFTLETGRAAITEYIAHTGSKLNAVFAASDTVAMGVVVALREANLRVPDDVSVIGYNGLPIAKYFQVPLTTIKQDTFKPVACWLRSSFRFSTEGNQAL